MQFSSNNNNKWKTRHELPALKKLNLKFDIEQMRADLRHMEQSKKWDGLSSEYGDLCDMFQQLPPFFLKEGESPDEHASYQQLALSEFDENYDLSQRKEKSGSIWDRQHPQNDKRADERSYRNSIEGTPPYLTEVLSHFRPYLHRARFARLAPNSQVRPHIDYDTTYGCRLHIPVITSAECVVGAQLKDGTIVEEHLPADGSVYFVNQGLKHWAINKSSNWRVHLILSVDTQKYLDV